jgi:hypothetical protein
MCSKLSGEEWADSLASIRPVGINVTGPFDSGIDRLWSASFQKVHFLIAKDLNFAENRLRSPVDAAITHQSRIPPGDIGVYQDYRLDGALSEKRISSHDNGVIAALSTRRIT